LKLYVYGYLGALEPAACGGGQAQCLGDWLINRIAQAFKTIADSRKDHAEAIVGVCRAFIGFCRE
jgi:hypothetical protein